MRLDAVDEYGRSLLHLAAAAGETHMVQFLLARGAPILTNPLDGRSPLHDACEGGHTGAAALLLGAGASTATTDRDGRNPAECAAARGHMDTVRLVFETALGGNIVGGKERGEGRAR